MDKLKTCTYSFIFRTNRLAIIFLFLEEFQWNPGFQRRSTFQHILDYKLLSMLTELKGAEWSWTDDVIHCIYAMDMLIYCEYISSFCNFHLVSVCLVATKELRDRGDHQHDLVVRAKSLDLRGASEWWRHLHAVEIILSSHHNNSTLKVRCRSLAALRVSLQLEARNTHCWLWWGDWGSTPDL